MLKPRWCSNQDYRFWTCQKSKI